TNKGHFRVEGSREGPLFVANQLMLSRIHVAVAVCLWCVNRTLSSSTPSISMFINTMFVSVCPNTTNSTPVFT
ncbi:MAG: hypothetical protein Q4B91_03150, partial [Atopobiaceae bacterium]|nr:hypothetical protein [Atopobiaceae bacterium]